MSSLNKIYIYLSISFDELIILLIIWNMKATSIISRKYQQQQHTHTQNAHFITVCYFLFRKVNIKNQCNEYNEIKLNSQENSNETKKKQTYVNRRQCFSSATPFQVYYQSEYSLLIRHNFCKFLFHQFNWVFL